MLPHGVILPENDPAAAGCVCVWNICTDEKLPVYSNVYECWCLQGDHPCTVCDGPTKRPQYMRISRLITVTYLPIDVLFRKWRGAKPRTSKMGFEFYTVVAIWIYFSTLFFLLGSCGILRDGEGLSREPWRGYLFGGLDSSLVYVQRFRKTIYLFAIFIEEIYFRSMLLVWFAL